MAVKQVAVRLKPEGGAEVITVFRQAEEAGVRAASATAAATEKATLAQQRHEAQLRRNAEYAGKVAREQTALQQQIERLSGSSLNVALQDSYAVGGGGNARASMAARALFAANDDDARRAAMIRAEIDPLFAAQSRYNEALKETNRLQAAGHLTTDQAVARQNQLQRELDQTTAALGRNTSGLTRNQMASRLNLARQGADVAVTAAMGMNPGMIAIQQGPQILDALATSGLKARGAVLLLGGALAVTGAAVAVLAAGWMKGEADALSYDRAVTGIGRTAGLTADELKALVEESARLGDVSIDSARKQAEAYLATGRIGGDVLGDLIQLGKDYASFMGVDAATATSQLAEAMKDPHAAGEQLTRTFGLLTQAQLDEIEASIRAGDQMEAQKLLLEALDKAVAGHADQVGTMTNAWDALANSIGNAVTKFGEWLYVTESEKLQQLIDQRAQYEQFVAGGRRLTRGQQRVYDEAGAEAQAIVNRRNARAALGLDPEEASANQAAQLAEDAREKSRRSRTDRSAEREARAALQFSRQEADRAAELELMMARAMGDVDHVRALEDQAALTARIRQLQDDGVAADKARTDALEEQGRIFEARRITTQQDASSVRRAASFEVDRLLGLTDNVKQEERRLELLQRIESYTDKGVEYYRAWLYAAQDLADVEAAREEVMQRQVELADRAHQLNVARLSGRSDVAEGLDQKSRIAARALEIEADRGLRRGEGIDLAMRQINEEIAAEAEGFRREWVHSFVEDIRSGGIREALASQFESAADRLVNRLIDSLFDMDWGAIFGGGGSGGGFGGDLLRMGASLFGNGFTGPGRNAAGTDWWGGGLSWLGEEGPELVNLPRGSQVISHPNAMRMMSQAAAGGGPTIIHKHYYLDNAITTPELMAEINRGDRQAARAGRDQGAAVAVSTVRSSAPGVQRRDRMYRD